MYFNGYYNKLWYSKYFNSILKFAYHWKVIYIGKYIGWSQRDYCFSCGFLPESFMSQPVQQALIQSFCQNHDKAIECLYEATAIKPEPSALVILGKIQMKANKTKVRKLYIIYMPIKTMFFLLYSFNILWNVLIYK